ncbi:low-specificity L-threonine aldolase [Undibacterium sp. TJN25]|uniref:low-specificity L-threonine aldolase n=1 Tax=Undibacterium sp. TJN25 TaxID=3413056 RepID=UPI003BF1BD66
MPTTIDLRSDTVTKPSAAMRAAMLDAAVGDDVYDQDPTIHRLQHVMAEQFGFEAALFFPTGTQSNLAALLAHCQRGDEYIVGQEAHTYKYEGGGAAVLGSIQPQPLLNQADGSIALNDIEASIKPDDIHFARTRLIALENTIGGRVLPMAYMAEVRKLATSRGLAVHLDGARVFNAAVKLGLAPADVCKGLDSVSVCLSKGLGTPAGSVLCGSKALIADARRWRKMLGGGMRQVGILAAAGLYALEHNVQRLAEDHENAGLLAAGLGEISELRVEPVQTNIVFVHVAAADVAPLSAYLANHGVVASVGQRTRLVTHLDVSAAQLRQTVQKFKDYFNNKN